MATPTVPLSAVSQLAEVLDSPEVARLIKGIELMRWTGRPGYPVRTMVGMCLVKAMYALPTWTRTVRLVREHSDLQAVLGAAPSEWAVYRFTRKLKGDYGFWLDQCVNEVLASLRQAHPGMGENIAIDASDLPAYANGHRTDKTGKERQSSDPDASWGHRSAVSSRGAGGFYGYKIDAAVDTATGLPIAWDVRTASRAEQKYALALTDKAKQRGFKIRTAIMDKGYDSEPLHDWLMHRGIAPVIPIKETAGARRWKPPRCAHGKLVFAGADLDRRRTKWRCPTGRCEPKSTWIRADRLHPLIPRESKRYRGLYTQRSRVEGEFGSLKHEWSLVPLRVRGLPSVKLHADLTVLARLACALARSRTALPLAA